MMISQRQSATNTSIGSIDFKQKSHVEVMGPNASCTQVLHRLLSKSQPAGNFLEMHRVRLKTGTFGNGVLRQFIVAEFEFGLPLT